MTKWPVLIKKGIEKVKYFKAAAGDEYEDEMGGRLLEEKLTDSHWVVVWSGDHTPGQERGKLPWDLFLNISSSSQSWSQAAKKRRGGILPKIRPDSLLSWELSQIENCQMCPDLHMGKKMLLKILPEAQPTKAFEFEAQVISICIQKKNTISFK